MENSQTSQSFQLDVDKTVALIQPRGQLSSTLKGFEVREQQVTMMRHVVEAYNSEALALIEAGTGTGKSIAYLIPAILWALQWKETTLIATNTIALQEQLIKKDIPMLTKALGVNIKAVLIKGMSNYVCLRKLADTKHEELLMAPEERKDFQRLEAWAGTTHDGSKSSLGVMPSIQLWERVAAESDACSNVQCPFYQECFFFKARRKAEDAQIMVANHHLLFADLAVRGDTENYTSGSILPYYRRIVIDEAHHIEDVATDFFGTQVSKLGILRTLARLASEKQTKSPGKLTVMRDKMQKGTLNINDREVQNIFSRLNFDFPGKARDLQQCINEAFKALSDFVEEEQVDHVKVSSQDSLQSDYKLRLLPRHYLLSSWKMQVLPPTETLIEALKNYVEMLNNLETDVNRLKDTSFQEQSKSVRLEIAALAMRLSNHTAALEKLLIAPASSDKVRWIECSHMKLLANVNVSDAELDLSTAMANYLHSKFATIVMCSATISTNRQFDFIRQRLGITEEKLPNKKVLTAICDSPFNYAKQSMLAIATDMPLPEEANFVSAAAEQIWQVLQVSRGGTFVLFTSYEMMQQCFNILQERLIAERFKAYKQGDLNRSELLSGFKSSSRSVLFGTDSFWEGVDVAGEALRCVIIVKLPFKVPSEPIIQARMEAIRLEGGIPFMDYLLPQAIVKFKQGFGRLIRNKNDRGCIVCLDKRLITKGYGKQILNSLPKCQYSFAPNQEMTEQMRTFYRKTHHLVMQQ